MKNRIFKVFAIDVTGDGIVDTRDAITPFRYVAGWDVQIYRGQATTHTHTVVTDKGYAATCTTDGLTDGKICSVCSTVTLEKQVSPATGHKIASKGDLAPTCESAGYVGEKYCEN